MLFRSPPRRPRRRTEHREYERGRRERPESEREEKPCSPLEERSLRGGDSPSLPRVCNGTPDGANADISGSIRAVNAPDGQRRRSPEETVGAPENEPCSGGATRGGGLLARGRLTNFEAAHVCDAGAAPWDHCSLRNGAVSSVTIVSAVGRGHVRCATGGQQTDREPFTPSRRNTDP